MLIEETTVPQSALPVTDFKDHLRLATGFGEDDLQDGLIEAYLRAAIAAIEARTGKILIERTFSWSVTFWRDRDSQVLPVAPVSAISDFAILDRNGSDTGVSIAEVELRPDWQRPLLRGAGATCLPGIPTGGMAQVSFIAGFGPDWADLPPDLAHAVILLGSHYYEYRHEAGLAGGTLPYSVGALIERYRSVRLGSLS